MPEVNVKKFNSTVLYVLNKVGGKPNIGETVLHKLMYFIDFDYFEKYSEYLTGAPYKKNHHGPTFPTSLIDKMKKNKSIKSTWTNYGPYRQKKFIAEKKPDLDMLSAREVNHIDEVLNKHSDKTAKQIEDYSHGDIPWIITNENEIISYESVFYRDDIYSVADYELNDSV